MEPLYRRAAALALAAGAWLTLAGSGAAQPPAKAAARPRIEVVFALDTTGSMGGLIEGAKRKIWSIVNQVVSGKPTPEVRIGLVAYRDRGDAYVTRLTALTADVDAVYAQLAELRAQGGGDGPESVNQALADAVTKIAWTPGSEVLKIVYLVGDAPPHMNYPDDVKYPDTCREAVRKNILINTVQCGSIGNTREIWTEIARAAEGRYVAIPQDGGTVAIATPFDAELAQANQRLAGRTFLFGARDKQERDRSVLATNAALGGEAGASRASVQAKAGRVAEYDLLDALAAGRVDLSRLSEEELPRELQGLSPKEREVKLAQLRAERQQELQRIRELGRQRDAYLAEQQKKQPAARDGFDEQVLTQLRDQAKRIGIAY
jgi:Mg-chelatase subunit ChlD